MNVVSLHVFLTDIAGTICDPELPVVPLAGQEVTGQIALSKSVALMRAGVVEREDTLGRAHHTEAMAIDLHHLHRPDGEVIEMGNGCGWDTVGCRHGNKR